MLPDQEAQLGYGPPSWSSYQQPAWRQARSGPELGMCTVSEALLAAACSQPAPALPPPFRRPAALFPPALSPHQDPPADLDPLDPRFLAHISDPSEYISDPGEHLVRRRPLCF